MSWSRQLKMELEPFFKPSKTRNKKSVLSKMKFLSILLHLILHIAVRVTRAIQFVVFYGRKQVVPPVTDPLLLKSATTLAKEIREGKLKSEDVILAYIRRIAEVDPLINATADRCYDKALEEARRVDAKIASGDYNVEQLAKNLPLLGVPFTVKIIFKVKGVRCTAGCEYLKDNVSSEDSDAVACVKKAGAIVLATTNMPEFGMGFESFNNVHGWTKNPYDTTCTSGGSSGGESALIGAAGSIFGIGNDMAGSVRVPAHFTGIYSHKPTRGTVPRSNNYPEVNFLDDFIYSGPMCRYAEDLALTMNVLYSEHEPRLQFGLPVDFKKLKIRFLTSIPDPLVYPVDEEIKEGLMNAASYFERTYGSKTASASVPAMRHACACFFHLIIDAVNQHDDLTSYLTGGRATATTAKLDALKFLFNASNLSLGAIFCLNFKNIPLVYRKKKVDFYKKVLQKLEAEFDKVLEDDDTVLFMPTFPTTAPQLLGTPPLLPSTSYTSVFNLTGFPSTQCKLGFKGGLPFGMQIVTRKNNDALSVACAIELERALGGWVPPGGEGCDAL